MEFANKRGIAILNSRGFVTEYAEELSELAKKEGCNIAILTDLDSSGLLISSKLPNAYRIGIDFKTLDYFEDIEQDDVEEEVTKKGENDSHLSKLKDLAKSEIPLPYRNNPEEWEKLIEYLDTGMRIEIDSIRTQLNNDNERFWDYILKELDREFPTRNYNRAIEVKEYVMPKMIDDFISSVGNILTEATSEKREEIMNDLANTEHFFHDIKVESEEIDEQLRSVSESDEIKKQIAEQVKKFLKFEA